MTPVGSSTERFRAGPVLVLFAIAAIAALLLVIFERIGLPKALVTVLGITLLIVVLIGAALMGATMRPSRFLAAGGSLGIAASSMASFALLLTLAATLADGFEATTLLMPASALPLAAGALALLPAALLTGPALRRSGAYTPVDFVRGRFGMVPAAAALFLAIAVLAPVAMAGAGLAVDGLIAAFGLTRPTAQSLALVFSALPFLIGGLMSGRMSLIAFGAVLTVGLTLPILFFLAHTGRLPARLVDAAALLDEARSLAGLWMKPGDSGSAGLHLPDVFHLPHQWSGQGTGQGFGYAALASTALGLSVVLVLCGLFSHGRSTGRDAGSAVLTMLMLAGLPLVSLVIAAGTLLDLKASLVGAGVAALPALFLDNSLAGLLRLCGTDPSAEAVALACAPASSFPFRAITPYVLKVNDIGIEPALLGQHAAEALRMPGIAALVYKLLPALGGLAALGLAGFALAATIAHDGLYRLAKPDAVASWRLAATRALTVIVLAAAIDFAGIVREDLKLLLGAALSLGVATLLPLLLLALLPRAGGRTALLTLGGGLAVFTVFLAQGPAAIAGAGLYGFIGALVMACAGLASCPPSEAERRFAKALSGAAGPAPILDRAT